MDPHECVCELFSKIVTAVGRGQLPPPLFVHCRSVLTGMRGVSQAGVKRYQLEKPATSLRYTQTLSVARIVLELTKHGKTMSQRDVYYSLKSIFKSQTESNQTILELGLMLGLKRHEMGIYPAAKGLLAGLLRFRFHSEGQAGATMSSSASDKEGDVEDEDKDEEEEDEEEEEEEEEEPWVDCCAQGIACEGVKISAKWTMAADDCLEMQVPTGTGRLPAPRYLIVVEKEGIFHRLCEDKVFLAAVPSILVSGCGYPDVPTRACVARIAERYPQLIVAGLCDYNSYGLSVLLTYRLPSRATRFEAEGFAVGQLRWLGLRRDTVEALRAELEPSHFQAMTMADANHARAMLRSPKMNELPEAFQEELEGMIELGVKLELESIYSRGLGALSQWLEESLANDEFI